MASIYSRGEPAPFADACEGKRRYASRRQALTGVRLGRDHGEQVHAYPCRFCGQWHVGHFQKGFDRRKVTRNAKHLNEALHDDFGDDAGD